MKALNLKLFQDKVKAPEDIIDAWQLYQPDLRKPGCRFYFSTYITKRACQKELEENGYDPY